MIVYGQLRSKQCLYSDNEESPNNPWDLLLIARGLKGMVDSLPLSLWWGLGWCDWSAVRALTYVGAGWWPLVGTVSTLVMAGTQGERERGLTLPASQWVSRALHSAWVAGLSRWGPYLLHECAAMQASTPDCVHCDCCNSLEPHRQVDSRTGWVATCVCSPAARGEITQNPGILLIPIVRVCQPWFLITLGGWVKTPGI